MERDQAQPAGATRAEVGERGLGVVDRCEDAVGVVGEQEAGRGRAYPPPHLLEQGGSCFRLEASHLLAHRRDRVAEDRGRPGDGAIAHNRLMDGQQAVRQHEALSNIDEVLCKNHR